MNRLKTSKDYPQFNFRIQNEAKDELEKLILRILDLRLKKAIAGQYKPKRNEILIEALKIGLRALYAREKSK